MADIPEPQADTHTYTRGLSQWWLNRSIRFKGLAVIALPVCGLVIALAAFAWLQQAITVAAQWVQHTQQVRLEAQGLQSVLVDAETGVRGYDITRQQVFLDPYTHARSAIPDALRTLRQLVADNPEQLGRLDLIETLANQQDQLLAANLALVDAAASAQPPALAVNLRDGKAAMDSLRQQIGLFLNAEEQLQRERDAALARQEQAMLVVLVVMVLVGALGALLAALLFSAGITQRLSTLSHNAHRLARGVALVPTPRSHDAIGQLAAELSATAATLTKQDTQLRRQAEALEQVVRERTASLHASEERFRLLVAGVKDYAIIMLDAHGQIVSWNTGAERITGYAAEEIIGQHVARLYSAADVAAGKPERELHGAAADGRYEEEGWRVRQDGSRYWAHVVVTALRDEAGKLRGFAKVSRDITESKRAEEAMRATTAELARSNAELEQFAYVASHDLQEPLRAVSGMVQLLRQRYAGQLDARADEYIGHAVDGATRMQTLINDLLAYARIGTRGQPLSAVDGATVVADAVRNLAVAIQESAAMITVDDLPTVLADRSQLTQLFQNLIGNAIKFRTAAPLTIHIGVERDTQDPRLWRFAVSDNGIGIEPAYFERIFGMFQRLHTRQAYPGTGIGLAICKKIVERHAGRIWVESAPGVGTTVYVALPVAESE